MKEHGDWTCPDCGGVNVKVCNHCLEAKEAEVLPTEGTREAPLTMARRLMNSVSVPPGYRAVMVVTDESGAFVSVSHNTTFQDSQAILTSALQGPGLEFHPR